MKYKVTEVTVSDIKVEYADSSWARIPISKQLKKDDIRRLALEFHNTEAVTFDKVSDVPVQVNYEDDTDTAIAEEVPERTWTYAQARANVYPTIGEQFDALYWARKGDDSHQTKIDTEIAKVKTDWPKTMSTMSQAEYEAKIKELYG
tara:strand:+ start:99 stop:539 length:441 start_codon:yes stop_codon:yes gene_type:complete